MTYFTQYLAAIRNNLAQGDATEHTHRPALKAFLEAVGQGVTATNEPKRVQCGAPDYIVSRKSQHGPVTLGYIEAKDVGKPLDEIERSEQMKRYRSALPNLILTDYLEFRWYVGGDHRQSARLARVSKGSKIKPDQDGAKAVSDLLAAFLSQQAEPIHDPKALALRMARLTHFIRDMIVKAFENQAASATLRDLHQAFKKALIPDLPTPQFADMFAQTLAYGLFAARCNHHGRRGSFKRLGAASEIPKTNPFLRQLFETITGTALDEEPFVGFVDDLAQLLADTEIEAVLADFGKRTKRQDPVVHFYETFLAAYDPKLREARGVYYTPEPVVSYIVRSVDHLLKTRFGCPKGLADTATVEYKREEEHGGKLKKVKASAPRVLILDPACGAGTFLYTVIDHIREEFVRQGNAGMWSGYVRKHLLPRIFGFELLMAPYAVAHFKLGMQLAGHDLHPAQREKWAYDFSGDERLGVFLTNTLEEAERRAQMEFGFLRTLTEEANAAVRIKRDLPILAVIGNPPYLRHSANRSFVERIISPGQTYKTKSGKSRTARKELKIHEKTFIGRLIQDYYYVDGRPLGEKNPKWLQDDYVKFIRWGQWRLERTGAGILAFITNHGYLDNPTFRGMRQQLMKAFTDIYILDLHGNARKKEKCPDGSKDENVFDIQQGVAIGIFVKEAGKQGPAKVHHAEFWGLRENNKYASLEGSDLQNTEWQRMTPSTPLYHFVPRNKDLLVEYDSGWCTTAVFPINSVGFQTHRDYLVMSPSKAELSQRMKGFVDPPKSDDEIRRRFFSNIPSGKYLVGDTRDWKLSSSRQTLKGVSDLSRWITICIRRPFDFQFYFYHPAAIDYGRPAVMDSLIGQKNRAILWTRPMSPKYEFSVFCASCAVDQSVVGNKAAGAGGTYVGPLYLYPRVQQKKGTQTELGVGASPWPAGKGGRQPNLNPDFVAEMGKRIKLSFVSDGKGDLKKTFGPEDVFHYMYAVFHSPTYRKRYAEFLKIDFPRVPLTSNVKLFRSLCRLGAELVTLHLLESPKLAKPIARFPVKGANLVEKGYPKYVAPGEPEPGTGKKVSAGRVYISKDVPRSGKKGQYFEGVPPEIWEFHIGGYQVCDKWLKDRRGRTLAYDDLEHYSKVVTAIRETIRLMGEIDNLIPGWPLS